MAQVVVKIKTRKQYGQIPSVIKTVRSNSAAAAYNFARRATTEARSNAHVITGHMKASINHERIAYGRHRIVVGAHYGAYEEYGTRHRPPHPFLRPAVQTHRAQFIRDMKAVFHR